MNVCLLALRQFVGLARQGLDGRQVRIAFRISPTVAQAEIGCRLMWREIDRGLVGTPRVVDLSDCLQRVPEISGAHRDSAD